MHLINFLDTVCRKYSTNSVIPTIDNFSIELGYPRVNDDNRIKSVLATIRGVVCSGQSVKNKQTRKISFVCSGISPEYQTDRLTNEC